MEVVKSFLENRKSDNYKHIAQKLLDNFQTLDINMRIKVHFLHSHLDRFPENTGDVSDEQDEWFHQDVKVMEEKHGKKSYRLMGQKHYARLLLVFETR